MLPPVLAVNTTAWLTCMHAHRPCMQQSADTNTHAIHRLLRHMRKQGRGHVPKGHELQQQCVQQGTPHLRHHPPCHHPTQVLRDLFLALGVKEQQVLPLEVESLNCGGNARCSMELTQRLGLKPSKVLMIQVSHAIAALAMSIHQSTSRRGLSPGQCTGRRRRCPGYRRDDGCCIDGLCRLHSNQDVLHQTAAVQ